MLSLLERLRKEFKPSVGMKTTGGLRLSILPKLSSPPEIKFAVFSDSRFWDPEQYEKFSRFLPEEFSLLGPPKEGQNCFGFVLDLERNLDRWEFCRILHHQGYEQFLDKQLKTGDIIAYYGADPDITGYTHAAKYVGDGRVISRCGFREGFGGPVIEHPIKEIIPAYYCEEIGVCWNTYRKK